MNINNFHYIQAQKSDLDDVDTINLLDELEESLGHIGMLAVGAMAAYARKVDTWNEDNSWDKKYDWSNTKMFWRMQDIVAELRRRSK